MTAFDMLCKNCKFWLMNGDMMRWDKVRQKITGVCVNALVTEFAGELFQSNEDFGCNQFEARESQEGDTL